MCSLLELLISTCTLVALISNNMDPDQTALMSSLVTLVRDHCYGYHDKIILKCIWIYSADVISRQHFLTCRIRVIDVVCVSDSQV